MDGLNILLTGGAGYIGSHLTHHLTVRGHNVTILDNFGNAAVPPLWADRCHEGDVTSKASLQVLEQYDFDVVVHLAARKDLEGQQMEFVNVVGTMNMVRWSKENNVPLFINISSAAVYGDYDVAVDEIFAGRKPPCNDYGESKWAAELIARENSSKDFKVVNLRLFNVAGTSPVPTLNHMWAEDGVCFKLAQRIPGGHSMWLHGDEELETTRDYIHVADVCKHIEAAFTVDLVNRTYDTFNVCSGMPTSLGALAREFQNVLGYEHPYEWSHGSAGQRFSCGDPNYARNRLGVENTYSLSYIVQSSLI